MPRKAPRKPAKRRSKRERTTGPTTIIRIATVTRDRLKAIAEKSRPPVTMIDMLDILVANEEARRENVAYVRPVPAAAPTQTEPPPIQYDAPLNELPRRRSVPDYLRDELEGPDWRS